MHINLRALVLLFAFAATIPTKADTPSQIGLRQLMEHRYGKLSAAEDMLIFAALDGETADCTELSGDDKNIRGDLLAWLCTNPQATPQVTYRGISVANASIVGKVDLQWAKISFPIRANSCVFNDTIELSQSELAFLNLGGSSIKDLHANATHFRGNVFLRYGFKSSGGVWLRGAKIDGNLECDDAQLVGNDTVVGLTAENLEVKGSVYLRAGFKAERGVSLTAAKIDGSLDCSSGEFVGNDMLFGLNASSIKVGASVFLRDGFKAEGGVNLIRAEIDGNLECVGGQFVGHDKMNGLEVDSAQIKANVFLSDGFKATGGVSIRGAEIDGQLDCGGGEFTGNDKVNAINAGSVEVKGPVFLRYGFKAVGLVSLAFAKIDGNLELEDGHFSTQAQGALDLRGAKTGPLFNTATGSQEGWPRSGSLYVDGFDYGRIQSASNAEFQLGWLRRQGHNQFRSQPFEQLADALRKMGLDEDARKVMIAKNIEHARYVRWHPEWLWYGLFGYLIGYGYSPWRAFVISIAVVVIGWWFFRRGYRRGLVTPTGDAKFFSVESDGVRPASDNYPKFNAFIYSLETFVPLVKFGLADKWEPNGKRRADGSKRSFRFPPKTGGWLRGYLWFHIIAGWVLSALWVGGITGLVKT